MLRIFKDLGRRKVYDPSESEAHCLFVSSKGLMKLCEVHQPLPNDASDTWDPDVLDGHRPGERIYVHSFAFQDFVARALPTIKGPFVLVTGDFWWDVTSEKLGQDAIEALLSHPKFLRWHVQNLGFAHPGVHAMPLGLDYHTISRNRDHFWGRFASPLAQENVVHRLRAEGPALSERTPLGYSHWHFAKENGDRIDVLRDLPKDASVFQDKQIERHETWIRNQDYFFTISPRGNGMDCHRTWESILIGSTPVIPDLPINRLFQDLPVVIVQDWQEVTPDFLARERERILDATFDFRPVLLEHWRRQLFGEAPLPELRLRYQDFMALGKDRLAEISRG